MANTEPFEYRELPVRYPVVKQRMAPATVTVERRVDGFVYILLNGQPVSGLTPERARQIAEQLYAAAGDPVPEV